MPIRLGASSHRWPLSSVAIVNSLPFDHFSRICIRGARKTREAQNGASLLSRGKSIGPAGQRISRCTGPENPSMFNMSNSPSGIRVRHVVSCIGPGQSESPKYREGAGLWEARSPIFAGQRATASRGARIVTPELLLWYCPRTRLLRYRSPNLAGWV
jgi:hypothetical protein